jgi:hypothetical protein
LPIEILNADYLSGLATRPSIQSPLLELTRRFNWSTVNLYRLNAPGQNHGVLLGTKGWTP